MNLERVKAAIDLRSLAPEAVERPAPGAAPTAFRIWRAGDNMTDKGLTRFTEKSARDLLSEQESRRNLLSIDVDHLSLSDKAPPESRKAVGWHRLEVRYDTKGQPELWATQVEWTDVARVGLEKDPPEWRYFSPAYDVDKKTREVTAYLNTALTNNPATWGVTALASSTAKETGIMTKKEIVAALKHMAQGDSAESKVCGAVLSMIESGKIPDDGDGDEGGKGGGDGDGDEKAKAAEKAKKDAEEAAARKAAEDKAEADRIAAARAAAGADDTTVKLAERVQALEAELAERKDNEERERLFASRPDFTAEVKKALEDKPIETLRFAVETFPRSTASRAASVSVQATRGAGQGEGGGADRTARLPPEERAALDHAMGVAPRADAIRRVDNRVSFSPMTKAEADRVLATRKNGGAQ